MSISRRAAVAGLSFGAIGAGAAPASASGRKPGSDEAAEIRAVVDGIDDAVDDKAWERCRRYFTDRVRVDFAALDGGKPAEMKADDLIAAWRRNLYAEKASFHMRSNHSIEIDGDRAKVRSKGYAFNRLSRPLGDDLWEVWAYYEHELRRTSSGWHCSAIALAKVLNARGNELARIHVPS